MMRGRYQAYPEYKDSVVEFIGRTPVIWEVTKFKYAVNFQEGPGILAKDFFDFGVPLLRIQNTKEEFVTDDFKTFLDLNTVNQRWKQFKVQLGDIIISCSASTELVSEIDSRTVGAIPYTGLIRLRPKTDSITKNFIKYFVQSEVYHEQIRTLQTGATIQHYGPIHINQIFISIPDVVGQICITNFLDHETAKIDTLIEKQQQLIKLLKEKRQAVISHAVTKGLNPDALMRDSGVEWLGAVPEHWIVCAIKHQLVSLDYRRIPLSSEERGSRSGCYRYYGASGVIDYIDDYIFDEPTVLVGEDGANIVNRNTPLAFSAYGKYWVNNHAHILKPNDGLAEYWAEVIEHIDVNPLVSGSAQPKLTAEALNNLKIAFPPSFDEREELEQHINKHKSKFKILIEKASKQIKLLQERRTALIAAAVTGKIDVRNWQPPEQNQTNKEDAA